MTNHVTNKTTSCLQTTHLVHCFTLLNIKHTANERHNKGHDTTYKRYTKT